MIDTLKDEFGTRVGYSDHTNNLQINLMALARGAVIFEKHFTMDTARTKIGDHKLSSDPNSFKVYCDTLRKYSSAIGHGDLNKRPDKVSNNNELRRSYYAARDLAANTLLREEDIIFLRPRIAEGVKSKREILNRRIKANVKKGMLLKDSDFV